jgi:hypothetical protein
MVETFEALAVFLVVGLPGALYTWAFERQVGQWGATAADRVLRFVAGSAVFHTLFAPVDYWIWLRFVHTGRLTGTGAPPPLYLWAVLLGYVALPFVAGSIAGQRCASAPSDRLSRLVNGPNPAPRAWDHLFANQRRNGWVRLKLKSGVFVGGLYANIGAERSYASGFPFDQELFLVRAARVDRTTGAFISDSSGKPIVEPFGILVRWEEVEYLDIENFP